MKLQRRRSARLIRRLPVLCFAFFCAAVRTEHYALEMEVQNYLLLKIFPLSPLLIGSVRTRLHANRVTQFIFALP
jgi:hypothetical protein